MGNYKVTVELNEKKQAVVKARDQKIIADTIPLYGGTGEGFLPPELLIAALGACQLISAKLYARKFDVEIQSLTIELEGSSEKLEGTKEYIPEIKFKTIIESNSPENNVRELIKFVEENCFIGNTLANQVKLIQTEVTVKKVFVN